jgi:hypothetical protein
LPGANAYNSCRISLTEQIELAARIAPQQSRFACIIDRPVNYDSNQVWVMPPRVLFTPHERGKNLGTAGATDMQRTIVRAALRLLETAYEPFMTQDWEPEPALA